MPSPVHFRLTAVLLALLLIMACKTPTYTLDTLPEEQLRFGSGGGFAGTSTEHLLLANGQYFKKPQGSRQLGYITRIDPALAKRYLQRAGALGLNAMDFNHPGNMYYYLDLRGGATAGKITWGDINHEPPAAAKALYKELLATVSPLQREMPGARPK